MAARDAEAARGAAAAERLEDQRNALEAAVATGDKVGVGQVWVGGLASLFLYLYRYLYTFICLSLLFLIADDAIVGNRRVFVVCC